MGPRTLPLLLALFLLPVAEGAAQLPVSILIEARGGLAIPTGELAGQDGDFSAESGPAYGGSIAIFPTAVVGVFAGYQRIRFACERCEAAGLDGTATAEGPEAGVHLALPIGTGGMTGWLRGGVAQQMLIFTGFDDEMSSEPEIGFAAGVGATIPVASILEVVPAIRYSSVPAAFEFTDFAARSVQVSALSFDLGLALRIR